MKSFSPAALPKLMFPLVLMTALAGCPQIGTAEIYKWVDEHNQTQYTQMPPPVGIAAVRIESAAVPVGESHSDGHGLQERLKASEEQQKEADEASARTAKKAEIARIIKENCAAARNNLEQLNRSGQIRYRDSDGRVLRLSDEDRALRIEEARTQIKEFCKG